MRENKKNNIGLIVLIVVLLLICMGMGTFIFINKDKLMSKENTAITAEKENNISKDNGECPLMKFDNTYVLTDNDKEEIINSLELLNIGITKENVDFDTFTISNVAVSGYYIIVKFDYIPKTSNTFAEVAKVNGKFKVIGGGGSGDTADGIKRMEYTLERICK